MICAINFKKSKKLISHHENFKRKFFLGLIKIPFFLGPHVLELSYMEKKHFWSGPFIRGRYPLYREFSCI
jgi:hypothetical protein